MLKERRRENKSLVIKDLSSILYELSMSFGSSIDLEQNCYSFFDTLLKRQQLTCATFISTEYTYSWPLSFNNYYAFQTLQERLIQEINGPLIVQPSDSIQEELSDCFQLEFGHFSIFPLSGSNFLILCREHLPFDFDELNEFVGIIEKFGIFMQVLLEQPNVQKKELKERKAIYEALIENSFSGIDIIEIEADNEKYLNGNLIVRNEKMNYLFEGSKSPLLSPEEILQLCPETQPNGISSLDFFRENTEILLNSTSLKHDLRLQHSNGKIIDLEVINQIVSINDKKILIRLYEDVTNRKKQQEIIKTQVKDLSKKNQELLKYIESNGELENFAYVASHDLQAPLRTISSFTGLLKRKLTGKLAEDEQEYMDFIISGTKDMQLLIRDLLTYSRVNTNKCKYVSVDIHKTLEDVTLQLSTVIEEKQATVNIHDMPEFVDGDLVKFRQLFQNLITNALKFSKTDTPPVIDIRCEEKESEWLFSVADNGIGIPEESKEKIFMLFRRLHANSDYEGTGIGLALCKKIVEQHKGMISVESEPGKGCTFYISIRKDLIATQDDPII